MPRRRLTEDQVIAAIRRSSGKSAASTAADLLTFAHEQGALVRRRHASVSVRIALRPGDRPATLFVLPAMNRIYTAWLTHWPKPFRHISRRYAEHLQRVFPKKNIISNQAARRNIVTLEDARERMSALQRAIRDAIERIRAVTSSASGALDEGVGALEGELRRRMIIHRKREGWLRRSVNARRPR